MKLPKKPKAPKRSASLRSWEKYDARMNAWRAKVSAMQAAIRKKEQLIAKYQKAAFTPLRKVA